MSGAIWLASYPKSGNTWARLLLLSLRSEGRDVDLEELGMFGRGIATHELMDRWLEIDSGELTEEECLELRPDFYAVYCALASTPQFYKVHDAWIRTPSGRPVYDRAVTRAVLYFVRDPRDVAVSWSRFTGKSIDQAIRDLANPAAGLGSRANNFVPTVHQPMGRWSDHVTSWIDDSGLAPLVTRYEDMLIDPCAALMRMALHIGWDVTDEAIVGAVEATRFERLAKKEQRDGFFERTDKSERFFHTGRAGTWRDVLTADQVASIEREHHAVMARFGYS